MSQDTMEKNRSMLNAGLIATLKKKLIQSTISLILLNVFHAEMLLNIALFAHLMTLVNL